MLSEKVLKACIEQILWSVVRRTVKGLFRADFVRGVRRIVRVLC